MTEVFFESFQHMTQMERQNRGGLLQKCLKLARRLEMRGSIEKGDTVAIKLHMGEQNNPSYLSPAIVRFFADLVKEYGGQPFVTDTTSLYRYARHTMFEYLKTAASHGFTSETMGCPVIIADGLKGQSGTVVHVESPNLLKEITVAQYIYDADVLVSLAHVTMHNNFPLGATLKNVAMGCTTKRSKIAMHTVGNKPVLNPKKCVKCGACIKMCPGEAYSFKKGTITVDPDKCIGCAGCVAVCEGGAIDIPWDDGKAQTTILDGYKAVCSTFSPDKLFLFNFGINIKEVCDCVEAGLSSVVPDIGVLASRDGVALDKATDDLIVAAPGNPYSIASLVNVMEPGSRKADAISSTARSESFWNALVKTDPESMQYKLITK
jgi:hypothetical protein